MAILLEPHINTWFQRHLFQQVRFQEIFGILRHWSYHQRNVVQWCSLQEYPPKCLPPIWFTYALSASIEDFRWPNNASYSGWRCHYCEENTFVQKQNVFGKMIIFFTYIKEPSTIFQSASFIINMQLLGQSYFVGMKVSQFQNSADWCLTNFLIPRRTIRLMYWLLDCSISFFLFARYLCAVVALYEV